MGAVLPAGLVRKSVGEMEVGDVRWVGARAMVVDRERRCWLSPAHLTRSGFDLRGEEPLIRLGRREDGFVVNIAAAREAGLSWEMVEDVRGALPVVELRGAEEPEVAATYFSPAYSPVRGE